MECRLSGVVSDDAAWKFVPAVAHCAFEALWREGRLDEQCATDLLDLVSVDR